MKLFSETFDFRRGRICVVVRKNSIPKIVAWMMNVRDNVRFGLTEWATVMSTRRNSCFVTLSSLCTPIVT